MRWWSVVCSILLASFLTRSNAASGNYNGSVIAAVSASFLGAGDATLALRELALHVVRNTGVVAFPATVPQGCLVPDDTACLQGTLQALALGSTTVALVAVPAGAAPAAWELKESGIEELGEATTPLHRACLATKPPARSLLDLNDAAVAAIYHVSEQDILRIIDKCESPSCNGTALIPDWCMNNTSCATILTSREGEAQVLWRQIRTYQLYATVRILEDQLSTIAAKLAKRPIIACDWAPELTPLADLNAKILGPPPCLSSQPCPFESRRIVKFINVRELARAPSVVRALVRLNIPKDKMRNLIQESVLKGPEQAAFEYLKGQPLSSRLSEVRVAVLLPKNTSREAYDTQALAAAAALAEHDLEQELPAVARFKVEMHDDECHSAGAYQYLTNALGTSEFGALSALMGPACGAAWADMARQSLPHQLPILAYTQQAPASTPHNSPDTHLQLLAAGDARDAASALAALLNKLGWRRLAGLSEPATRPMLDAIRMHAKLEVHVEMSDTGRNSSVDYDVIKNWASRAAAENVHILYLCVEDARLARAAICAGHTAGLTPSNGNVWLVCGHRPGWLNARPGENCTTKQIEEVAEGHFTVTPEWAVLWQNNTRNMSDERRAWENRWRIHCRRLALASSDATNPCNMAPGPQAALLYDTIRQWAAALFRLLQKNPTAVDDLHNMQYVRSLINDTTTTEFTGLTGHFNWSTTDGAYARNSSMVLSQWNSKSGAQTIGTWNKTSFDLDTRALRWYSADGRVPDDGSEICALQNFADALHADCRTAFFVLGAILIVILVVILAATAVHCKRRAEQEYRKRLQALGMRPLANKPAGLDRWEIPRERVVINRKLGTGAFGTVYGGHALLAEDRGWTAVAVKTLKAGASTEEKLDFLSEAEAMKRFDHKNVVRLLGVVTKTEPVCTVMEFMLYGDLKNYLLARRHLATGIGEEESEGREADEASPRRLTGMALDVARALSYLAQLRYVHRDVAARNCLVSARRTVKLADFGMTRLVFENDYYRFSRKGMLPVRWMAPESLALGVFSPASDVWSFGVLLYEIVTFGSLPFQGLSNSEVLGQVKAGHTLELPSGLKPQLEGLIKSCWQQDPKKRPTASEVAAFLADAPRLLAPCLDVPLDALPLDADPPWRLPRDQAEARWVSWAAPASAATDTTYLSTDGNLPLDTDSFLP